MGLRSIMKYDKGDKSNKKELDLSKFDDTKSWSKFNKKGR